MEEVICDEATKARIAFPEYLKVMPEGTHALMNDRLNQAISHATQTFLYFEQEWTGLLGQYGKSIPPQILPYLIKVVLAKAQENGLKLAAIIYRETGKFWFVFDEILPGWTERYNQALLAAPAVAVVPVAPVAPVARVASVNSARLQRTPRRVRL